MKLAIFLFVMGALMLWAGIHNWNDCRKDLKKEIWVWDISDKKELNLIQLLFEVVFRLMELSWLLAPFVIAAVCAWGVIKTLINL